MLISDIFLLVKEPLVAAFSETRAVTSYNDVVKQGMKISKAWENINYLGNLVQFFLNIALKILVFEGFFTLL